ncbi:MAG: hybrid sensor histidine kinase/response regulator [Bacteroidales bacterium]|nr:hybrid sensor histidine kinase/response regulator [Bacteroidales bacterium]MDY0216888.1 hybrid sensor histidine kinase/response regulator [Bacteroidales bacterium]
MKDYIPKILLVDDIPQNIQVLGGFLSDLKYHLSYATSAMEALRLVKSNQYDLILLDIMMPDMDGFTLCHELKGINDVSEVPIIFISARTDQDSILKGFQMGGVDYITKPFNSHELIARVKTHIELRNQKRMLQQVNNRLEGMVDTRTEELRKANNKLMKLDDAKNDFLQLISHELRTPLNNITLLLDVLKLKLVDEKYNNYFIRIEDSMRRLIEFSELALLITTMSASVNKQLNWNRIIAKDLMDNILQKNASFIAEKDIKVYNTLEVSNLSFMGEYFLIEKSFDIVVNNAVKYSEYGGSVYIIAEKIDSFIVFRIKDEGCGFDESSMESFFTAFSVAQIDHHQQGFGLSLRLLNMIVEAHFGKVEIQNNPDGKGATVSIFLRENLK